MYLSNEKLTKIYEEVISECNDSGHEFDPDKQIKVCSIDIRVGRVFWITRKNRNVIDLGANALHKIHPRRLWKKVYLEPNESIILKPGEMILGRTYERITIPPNYVGKINTRGSYARLGISTAQNCDLINPGYSGFVPLELTNSTQNKFEIRPYLPLCQIFIMPLLGPDKGSYLDDQYNSKYIDDDGGPSLWWEDDLVKKIAAHNLSDKMTSNTIKRLKETFDQIDMDGLDRLDTFINRKNFDNADMLISQFSKSEKVKKRFYKFRRALGAICIPVLLIPSIDRINEITPNKDIDLITWILWSVTIISIPFAFYYYYIKDKVKFYDDID